MKELKDKFVSPHLWYMVLAYLHEVQFKWVFDRHLEKYDESEPETIRYAHPKWQLEWLDYEQFTELVNDALKHFMEQSKDITEENIVLYAEK